MNFEWVKGHTISENERCDALAVEAAKQDNLPFDMGYEILLKAIRSFLI